MQNDPKIIEPDPAENSAAKPLDYAQRPTASWWRRRPRLLVFLALQIAIAAPIWWYWAPLKHRALRLYWSHRAAAFQMPNPTIDVDYADPVAARRVASTNPSFKFPMVFPTTTFQRATYVPNEYRQLLRFDPRLNLTGGYDQPVTFMGTLRRPDRSPRLVIVTGAGGNTRRILGGVFVLVLPLPRWNDPLPPAVARQVRRMYGGSRLVAIDSAGIPIDRQAATVLKSGLPDPSDPTHITFEFLTVPDSNPYASKGGGIIDANLRDDDSIAFTLRSFSGTDPNVRLGDPIMPGDPQTLQVQAGSFFGASKPTVPSSKAPATRSR